MSIVSQLSQGMNSPLSQVVQWDQRVAILRKGRQELPSCRMEPNIGSCRRSCILTPSCARNPMDRSVGGARARSVVAYVCSLPVPCHFARPIVREQAFGHFRDVSGAVKSGLKRLGEGNRISQM